MIEIAYYNKKRGQRWVLSIGRGGPQYGQLDIISLVREDIAAGQVIYARYIWGFLRKPNNGSTGQEPA